MYFCSAIPFPSRSWTSIKILSSASATINACRWCGSTTANAFAAASTRRCCGACCEIERARGAVASRFNRFEHLEAIRAPSADCLAADERVVKKSAVLHAKTALFFAAGDCPRCLRRNGHRHSAENMQHGETHRPRAQQFRRLGPCAASAKPVARHIGAAKTNWRRCATASTLASVAKGKRGSSRGKWRWQRFAQRLMQRTASNQRRSLRLMRCASKHRSRGNSKCILALAATAQ